MFTRSFRPPGAVVIEIEVVTKLYRMGAETIHALRGVDLTIRRNEYLAIMGPSGSGKSTLMNMLGCLDTPTAGHYDFNGKNVATMVDDELAEIRNKEIGFVFQTFNLLPRSNALHNVELPLIYAGMPKAERLQRARRALENVGLRDRMELGRGTTKFLESEIADVRSRIIEYERSLKDLKARNGADRLSQADVLPYIVLQETYRELLAKVQDSRIAAELERRQIGEQFRILDPARLPEAPENPNRVSLALIGALIGLLIGLALTALRRGSNGAPPTLAEA